MILTLSGVRALSMYLFRWSCSSRSSVWLCNGAALRPPRFMRWCGVLIICPVVIFLYLDFWGFNENPFSFNFIFSRVTWLVGLGFWSKPFFTFLFSGGVHGGSWWLCCVLCCFIYFIYIFVHWVSVGMWGHITRYPQTTFL